MYSSLSYVYNKEINSCHAKVTCVVSTNVICKYESINEFERKVDDSDDRLSGVFQIKWSLTL